MRKIIIAAILTVLIATLLVMATPLAGSDANMEGSYSYYGGYR